MRKAHGVIFQEKFVFDLEPHARCPRCLPHCWLLLAVYCLPVCDMRYSYS